VISGFLRDVDGFFTPEDETDGLSRKVGNKLPNYQPRRRQFSSPYAYLQNRIRIFILERRFCGRKEQLFETSQRVTLNLLVLGVWGRRKLLTAEDRA
jgi:hypothetical protein